jgi:hypothetical protein
LAPTACVAERGVLFWSEPCRRVPARGDMVRAMLGDSWSRNVDAILHVLIGVPETDEMPDRRVCGDVAAGRQALSAPPPPSPPLPGGPNSGDLSVSCQHVEAADSDSSGRPPTQALWLLLLLLFYLLLWYHMRPLRMYARTCVHDGQCSTHICMNTHTIHMHMYAPRPRLLSCVACVCTHLRRGKVGSK